MIKKETKKVTLSQESDDFLEKCIADCNNTVSIDDLFGEEDEEND